MQAWVRWIDTHMKSIHMSKIEKYDVTSFWDILVLESFWPCFGVRYGFGSNLDLDWRRLAPSLLADISRDCNTFLDVAILSLKHTETVYVSKKQDFILYSICILCSCFHLQKMVIG